MKSLKLRDDKNKSNFDFSLVFLSKYLTYPTVQWKVTVFSFMFLSEHENLSLGIFNRKNELLEWHTELGIAFEGGSFGEFPFSFGWTSCLVWGFLAFLFAFCILWDFKWEFFVCVCCVWWEIVGRLNNNSNYRMFLHLDTWNQC